MRVASETSRRPIVLTRRSGSLSRFTPEGLSELAPWYTIGQTFDWNRALHFGASSLPSLTALFKSSVFPSRAHYQRCHPRRTSSFAVVDGRTRDQHPGGTIARPHRACRSSGHGSRPNRIGPNPVFAGRPRRRGD